MAEPIKVGSKYHVYDHIVNITRIFKKKVEADEFADTLNNPPTVEDTNSEGTTTTTTTNDNG